MALGLGFNKAKILQTAEKYVAQGKLAAAIGEYRKILKKDPRDLMTLNTVGDLYVREGKNEEAIQCFYELAEKSVEAGFIPRAIAVYKRITKIDQEAMPALTKLGELYSTQGLMRDARSHYLQAVEIFMRRRNLHKACEVFERILSLDMENPRLQRRMAELCAETGKTAEAVAAYLSAAERFVSNKEAAEAGATLDALLKVAPENPDAQILRGRIYSSQGDAQKAIATLQSIPSLGTHKEALNSLFHAYRQQGELEPAREVAQQLFESHEDFAGLALLSDDLVGKGDAAAAFAVYQKAAQRLLGQGAFGILIEGLQKIVKLDLSNIEVLELLWSAYRRKGDVGEGRETAERLAHAYVVADQLEQAREVYAELVALEPDNAEHQRLLRQVQARLRGAGPVAAETISQQATPLMAMEIVAAPEEDSTRVETLPPREQALVKNCLTESELYITYRQVPRAIETLENGLLEVPGNVSLYEQLLPLYEQIRQYQKAAQCAQALTEAYEKQGDQERAVRYRELAGGYQQKIQEPGTVEVVEVISEPGMAGAEPSSAAPPQPPAEQPQVREIDLSMEWASLSESAPAPATTATPASLIEEIEFYLQAGLTADATAAIQRLREQFPSHEALPGFEQRLGLVPQAESLTPPQGRDVMAAESSEAWVQEVPSIRDELPAEIAAGETGPAIPTVPMQEEPELALEKAVQSGGLAPADSGFELALGENPQEVLSPPPMPPASEPARQAEGASAGFLDEVFAEFKEGVGEPASADDLETHYSMGVAFKEMALYEEAIGEFQKVHQLAMSAKDYSHLVLCCSLLAACFLEKGMPELAVKWYQTALDAPGVDAESSLALLYEMGSAYETAGDRPAALKSFLEVYARNIDYRNVAERIRDLQQGS